MNSRYDKFATIASCPTASRAGKTVLVALVLLVGSRSRTLGVMTLAISLFSALRPRPQ